MHPKTLVKWTNRIAVVAILALIYWVFAFIIIQVFDIRIFRQNMTEIFAFSVLGILAVMAGSLMLNIMLNLTQIAEVRSAEPTENTTPKSYKKLLISLLAIFPIIASLLFLGNIANTNKKREFMTNTVSQIAQSGHSQKIQQITQQNLSNLNKQDVINITSQIEQMSKFSPAIHHVEFIVPDTVNGEKVFLVFTQYPPHIVDTQSATEKVDTPENHIKTNHQPIDKSKLIQYYDTEKNRYLQKVFNENSNQTYFYHNNGNFELWYPYLVNGKVVGVYYVSDYMRYGKYGS